MVTSIIVGNYRCNGRGSYAGNNSGFLHHKYHNINDRRCMHANTAVNAYMNKDKNIPKILEMLKTTDSNEPEFGECNLHSLEDPHLKNEFLHTMKIVYPMMFLYSMLITLNCIMHSTVTHSQIKSTLT